MSLDPAATLARARILVTRDARRGAVYEELLRGAGARPIMDPLQEAAPPAEPLALRRRLDALAAGEYDWLVLTSARAVDAIEPLLRRSGAGVPIARARVAVVGEATGRRARSAGLAVDLCPARESAAGLLAQWPSGTGRERVLLPVSALAPDTLADGLAAFGATVDRVEAYRMVPTPLSAALAKALDEGRLDAAVVTSGSAARRLAQVLAQAETDSAPRIVAIGTSSAAAALQVGLEIAATAARPDPSSVLIALEHAFPVPLEEK